MSHLPSPVLDVIHLDSQLGSSRGLVILTVTLAASVASQARIWSPFSPSSMCNVVEGMLERSTCLTLYLWWSSAFENTTLTDGSDMYSVYISRTDNAHFRDPILHWCILTQLLSLQRGGPIYECKYIKEYSNATTWLDITSPCDVEIWWMTLKKNRAPLLYYIKLCASFQIHQWIQTGVTVRKGPIWVKVNDFFSRVTLQFDIWP